MPGAIPSFHQDREAFPYTICVQKEMIRYRPATSYGIPHVASEDIVAGGYLIPKDSVLISSMGAMHMNESIYKNAKSFDPDRFKNNTSRMSASANSKVDDRDIFAFGWGRRMCLGIHLVSSSSPLYYNVRLLILPLYRPSWSCLAFTFDSFPNLPSNPNLMLKVILCQLISKDLWMKGLSTSHFHTRFALCLDHKHTFILHMAYNKERYSNFFLIRLSISI